MTSTDTDARRRLERTGSADTKARGEDELRAHVDHLEAEVAALKSSDAQHRSVIASIQDGYVEIGLRGQFLTANDSFCRITGYSLEELLTMNFQAVVDTDTAARLKHSFATVMATREPIDQLEWEFVRADGEHRTLEGSVQIILDEHDQPVGFRGIGRDITGRKQREQQLAESEAKYRTILETLQDGYYELDAQGRFVFFNNALLRITGYSQAELRALDFRSSVDDDTADRLLDLFQTAARTGQPAQGVEWEFIRGDGVRRTVTASIAAMYDASGELSGFRGTLRDTTDVGRLSTLETLNKLAATVADALPTAVLALEADGTVVATNAAWLEAEPVNGIGVASCRIGDDYLTACAESRALTKTTRETIVRGVRDVIRGQQDQFDLDYPVRTPNGDRRFIVRVRPVQADIPTRAVVTHIDVTDRVRAQEAVRESEARLNRAQEVGAIGTWEFDCVSNEIFWSDGTYRLYGLEPRSVTPMEALRMTIAPKFFKERAARIDAAIRTPGRTDFSYPVTWPDGSQHVIHHYGQTVCDSAGNAVTMVGTIQDVTERERTAVALRSSERRLAGILDIAIDAIISMDEQQRIVMFNDGAESTFGYQAEEVIGQPIDILIPDTVAAHHGKHVADFGASADTSRKMGTRGKIEGRRKDGTCFPAEASISKLKVPEGLLFTVILRDVSEQIEAQRRLQDSEATLARAQSVAHVGSWEWNFATSEFNWSDETYRLFGAEPGAFKPTFDTWVGFIDAEDRTRIRRAAEAAQQGGPYNVEYNITLPDGRRRRLHAQAELARDEDGAVTGLIGATQDITERVATEQALRASEDSLARAQAVAQIGSWDWDVPNGSVRWSKETYRLLQVKPEGVDPSFELFLERIHPDDRDAVTASLDTALAGQARHDAIFRALLPDGTTRRMHVLGEVVVDDQGKPTRMVGTIQDVTVRSEAEEALRASEDRFRNSLQRAADPIWIIDDERTIVYANGAAASLFGYRADELVGMRGDDLVPAQDRAGLVTVHEQLRANKTSHRLAQVVRADGQTLPVELHTVPLGDGTYLAIGRDMTEWIDAQEALRDSEERWRRITDEAADGIVLLDAEFRYTYANDTICKMLGISREEMIGKRVEDFLAYGHEDAPDIDQWRAVARDRGVNHGVFRFRRKDGSVVLIAAHTLNLPDGTFHSILRDVTADQAAQAALRSSEEALARGQRVARIGSWEHDVQSGQQTWSDETYRIWGFEPGSIQPVHGTTSALMHPDDRERAEAEFQAALAGGTAYDLDYRAIIPGQGEQILHVHSEWLHEDGLPERLVGTVQNVTKQRRAEEEVRKYENRLRALVANAPVVLLTTDAQGLITLNDGSALADIGMKPGELVGKPVSSLNVAELDDAIGRGLRGESLSASFVCCGVRFEGHITPLLDANGDVAGATCVAINVHEKLQLEDQLRQAQKMEAVGRLAGGIAHDFNNMLSVINGYSELALASLSETHPLFQDIEEIKHAGERAAALTRQLLTFSRRQVLQPQVLDVNDVIGELEKMLRRLLGADVTFSCDVASRAAFVRVDRGQLEQVLMNLVINARDAMPDGGRLNISTDNVTLGVAAARQIGAATAGEFVTIAVADSGTGMSEEVQAHVFEPFFTTKEPGKGTGLGLSTVYGIVTQSDGQIRVDSTVGSGTTFTVYLPAVVAPLDNEQAEHSTAPNASGSETILVVEDEAAVRSLVTKVLRGLGYTVLDAENGERAIAVLDKSGIDIDLVLTDLVMPEMNGRELAAWLRGHNAELRVLYMSGYAEATALNHHSLEPGASFIQKPFSADALSQKVRACLTSDQLQRP